MHQLEPFQEKGLFEQNKIMTTHPGSFSSHFNMLDFSCKIQSAKDSHLKQWFKDASNIVTYTFAKKEHTSFIFLQMGPFQKRHTQFRC